MKLAQLRDTLHPLERKVLPALEKANRLKAIVRETKLQEVEVTRALQWLQNKGIIAIKEETKGVLALEKNGLHYQKAGLPERRFLSALVHEKCSLDEIKKKASLQDEEIQICLGVLRAKAAITIGKDNGRISVSITEEGKRLLSRGFLEEQLLKKQFPLESNSLSPEEKFAAENLLKRKQILKRESFKDLVIELSATGKKLLQEPIELDVIDRLTPKMLIDDSWKQKKLRRYDIKINVPNIFPAKKQHYRRFLDEVREKFLALGFIEMDGPMVESAFWDMDALFMPQFHSARDIHGAYFVREPRYTLLDKDVVGKVKQAHENGFDTGSKGWQYNFNVKETHRLLLRTQGTSLSARMLASPSLKIPGKYFAIARCFRPDVVDATHNADFNQVEGIVVEDGLNFQHLKGLLKLFAEEFAETSQIKIIPAYFPFTEPSAELHAKHPELGWIELAGSGIFRPEMVKPLVGREVPVIAWGVGIDRLAMFSLGIKDIRQLFSHDLEFLRKAKVV